MKKVFKLLALTLTLAATVVCLAAPSMAAEGYTYTVTVSDGGLAEASLNPGPYSGYDASLEGGKLVIRNVPYDTTIDLTGAVTISGESKYIVRGYVRAGQDYDKSVWALNVKADTEIVAAYSVPGQQVGYTVNYVDENGSALAESQTFFGTIGDKPVATYVYVDGYVPQALNLTKTLSADEGENVFTFVYSRVVREIVTTVTATAAPAATAAPGEGETGEEAGAEAGEAAAEELTAGEVPAAETPAEPQELIDLDQDRVPLAQADDVVGGDGETAEPGEESGESAGVNKGVVIGGCAAAVVVAAGIIAVAVASKKKKKATK